MLPVGITDFSQTFSGVWLAIYILIAVGNGVLIYFASLKFLLVLQQSGYKRDRYFKWLVSPSTPYLNRLMLLCISGFLFFTVLGICFEPVMQAFFGEDGKTIAAFVGFFAYIFFTIVYINTEASVNAKVPLNKTKRLIRLGATHIVLVSLITFGVIVLLNYVAYLIGDEVVAILRFAPICVMPIAAPYLLSVSNSVNMPFERAITKRYVKLTTEKLNKTDVLKIGITGSYGKTSVKEILKTILSQKYRVLATPASYNTPMGISLSVKNLDNTYDVFIAEMGARNKGDIKELADIVKPSIGIITGINNQHLESFKSIENTVATKYELIESLGEKGTAFFTSDNAYSLKMYQDCPCEKYTAGLNEGDAYATDVKTERTGTTFTLNIEGEKPVKCSTVLLGTHSISNVCLAAAVAHKIGLTAEEIAAGVNRIKTVGHRLELLPNNKGIVIIDDSYNSNPDGIVSALEVISMFSGRKIVLTPGLIELGKIESEENYKFGKLLAGYADIVIIIGRHNAEMLIAGLTDGGMSKENIKFSRNSKRGRDELDALIKEGDVVLFENDLPDNYS